MSRLTSAHSQTVFESDTDYMNTTEASPIDPIAISAFIGDLTSLGLLPYDLFKVLMEFLMNRMSTRLHIDAIHAMLSHAAAHPTPKLPLTFLYECRAIVKRRSKKCMWPVQPIVSDLQLGKASIKDLTDAVCDFLGGTIIQRTRVASHRPRTTFQISRILRLKFEP